MKRKVLIAMFIGMCILAGCQKQKEAGEKEVIEINMPVGETTSNPDGNNDNMEVDVEASDEVIDEVIDEDIDEAVDSLVDYQAFVGNYQDSVSQRATAVITENDDMLSAHVEISWANSAVSACLWTMDVTFEDEKLVYTNGEKFEINYDENGNEEKLGEFIEMHGYFEWDGATGNISWTGAEEEECRGCVFEKIN